jgi:hypothetical protein
VIGGFITGVAGFTIRQARMVEISIPIIVVMTFRALTRVMIGRFITRVARNTIRLASVVETDVFPRSRHMAGRTFTTVVISGFITGVAGFAIGSTSNLMIETWGFPG